MHDMTDSGYGGFTEQSYKPDLDVSYFLDDIKDVTRIFPRIFKTPTSSFSALERAHEALKNYGYLDAQPSIDLKN